MLSKMLHGFWAPGSHRAALELPILYQKNDKRLLFQVDISKFQPNIQIIFKMSTKENRQNSLFASKKQIGKIEKWKFQKNLDIEISQIS